MNKSTKIVATLGPASNDEQIISRLIEAGMDVARLNFSHGTHEEHTQRIQMLRKLSNRYKKPITILQDLQGPKLRVGNLPKTGLTLTAGEKVILCDPETKLNDDELSGIPIIPLEVPNLINSINKGKRILLDDGYLEISVVDVQKNFILGEVVLGGILKSHKGVNLPGIDLQIPAFTEKDRRDLAFGLEIGVDAIAISFIQKAGDIDNVRNEIKKLRPDLNIPIIAKMERPEAIDNLEEILHATDGVMVARGDLAVETSPSIVPIIQKRIIQQANAHHKIVITATQMLESMIHNPRPTRAEASDVANAIFDGSDAVMLSGETAMGAYPLESVQIMTSIILEAEKNYEKWGSYHFLPDAPTQDDAVSITRAARELAKDRNVSCIAVFTQSGTTALLMSKARPSVPIMAFTSEKRTFQKLGLFWGVTPFLVPFADNVENMVSYVEAIMLSNKLLKQGEQFILLSGHPVGEMRPPNMMLLHTLGEPI